MLEFRDADGTRYLCAQTMDDCEVVLRAFGESDINVYDSETSGLSRHKNHVVGHVITPINNGVTFYVPVRHAGGGNVPGCKVPTEAESWDGSLHPFEREFAKVARERPRRLVGHNLAFDLGMTHPLGIEFYGTFEDTMINAPLIDENSRSFSMENVAIYNEVRLKDTGIYEYLATQFGGDAVKSQMANWWRTKGDEEPVVKYAGGDGYTTEAIWHVQQTDIENQDLGRVHDVECRLIRTLHRTTSRGIRIDEDRLAEVHQSFESRANRLKEALPDWFTNINAPTQLKRYFEDLIDENWPRNEVTKAQIKKAEKEGTDPIGSLKFDEAILKQYQRGRDLIAIKKMEHAINSFTTPLAERHVHKGRVHTEFNQMKSDDYGTVTGRLSSSNPNLQQVPKRNKDISKPYRTVFLPEEGHIWYDNDYSQQEYVVFTNYTGDPKLVAGYRSIPPLDIHTTVAQMLNVERDPTAKRMNLGMLYGMGIVKLAVSLGVSEAQAREWMNLYHQQFPYARKFLKQAEARAKQRGYVHTKLGRRRRFPDARFAHKAGNAVIQGSSADITKLKMVEIDSYFESEGDIFGLMLQCHDSLSWTGPEGYDHINNEALRIMRNFDEDQPIHLDVPIAVDSGMGANWSVATFGQ